MSQIQIGPNNEEVVLASLTRTIVSVCKCLSSTAESLAVINTMALTCWPLHKSCFYKLAELPSVETFARIASVLMMLSNDKIAIARRDVEDLTDKHPTLNGKTSLGPADEDGVSCVIQSCGSGGKKLRKHHKTSSNRNVNREGLWRRCHGPFRRRHRFGTCAKQDN